MTFSKLVSFNFLLVTLFCIIACTTDAMDPNKENLTIPEILAAVRQNQSSTFRPSTPLDPNMHVHRPVIDHLKINGKRVTREDAMQYIGWCPPS